MKAMIDHGSAAIPYLLIKRHDGAHKLIDSWIHREGIIEKHVQGIQLWNHASMCVYEARKEINSVNIIQYTIGYHYPG